MAATPNATPASTTASTTGTNPGAPSGASSEGLKTLTVAPGAFTALVLDMFEGRTPPGWRTPPQPGEPVGRFEVLRELGRGAFGVVYEARDPELGRSVALKALRAPAAELDGAARGLHEAEAAAQLAHPSIVHLYDVGRTERGAYIVMELLRGEELSERLDRGPLPAPEAVRIAHEVARGVAHAHRAGVTHRDLKPGNVFLCEDGQVKILDFGMAHLGGRGLHGGTPGYMPPEQATGDGGDRRVDVYALGVLLFQMLEGRRPFGQEGGGLPAGVSLSVRGGAPLARLVNRMLASDPAARPPDGAAAEAELAALRRALEPNRRARVAWALAALAGAAALALAFGPRPAALPAGRLLVALADVRNTTGDADLDGLASLLETAVQQSRRVGAAPRVSLLAAAREATGRPAAALDEATARLAAGPLGARVLLLPSVERAGAELEVGLRGEELPGGRQLFSLRERAAAPGTIPEALDRLWDRARAALGDQDAARDRPRVRVAALAPTSPAAWRHYDAGVRLWEEGRIGEACAELARAAEADPAFALPHLELARCAGDIDEHIRHFELAMGSLPRLPPRERALVEARWALIQDRLGDARSRYQAIVEEWPEAPAPYREAAGFLLGIFSDPAAARPFLEGGLARRVLPPDQALWAALALEDGDAALDMARRRAEAQPGPDAQVQLAGVRRFRGEPEAAAVAVRQALAAGARPGPSLLWSAAEAGILDEVAPRFAGARGAGLEPWMLPALRGRWREARAALAAQAPPARAGEEAAGEFHGTVADVLYGEHLAGRSDPAALWREAQALWEAGDASLTCRAHALLLAGDPAHGKRIASITLRGRPELHCSKLYRNVLAWRTGDREGAALRLAAMYGAEPALLLAMELAEQGKDREALTALRRFRRQPSLNFDSAYHAYPRALLLEAQALERLGERDRARAAVEGLLRLWRDADPDLPLLAEARALRARLAG